MSGLTEDGSGATYLNIIGGKLRKTVTEDTPKAVKRDWETKDGKSGTKWELIYSKIDGHITGIEFRDGDYGEQLIISMKCGADEFKINTQAGSRYANDFLQRMPGVAINKEVEFKPYDVRDNTDPKKGSTGIKISIDGNVIKNFFWDGEEKKNINGFPVQGEENPSKDDWKVFFIGVKKFLKEYAEEKIIPKFLDQVLPESSTTEAPTPQETDVMGDGPTDIQSEAKETTTAPAEETKAEEDDLPF